VASGLVRCCKWNFSEACGVDDGHGNRKVVAPHDRSGNGAFAPLRRTGWARTRNATEIPCRRVGGTRSGNDFLMMRGGLSFVNFVL